METRRDRSVVETKEVKPITLEQTCVVGSVFFKDYEVPGSEGDIRGREAINSIVQAAKKGCKIAFIIDPKTDQKFVDNLKEELSTLGDKAENIVWDFQDKEGYSQSRREAILLARSKYPDTKAFIMQEIEKDLTEYYEPFLETLSDDRALVMMNRGINVPYNLNPWQNVDHINANLPGSQFWGERNQNLKMARQEEAFGLTDKKIGNHFWDRLNGTRVVRNEEMSIGGVKINPSDLMLLRYEYSDGYDEEDRKYKMDTYSAAVYNLIPILEALGGERQISETSVQYLHAEEQRKQEEGDTKYREKRISQKKDLPSINFDMVLNIKEWQEQGKWPQVLVDALKGDKKLEIKHFNEDEFYYGYMT
ncbi:MAG TPA: hypothetical protein VFI61_03680 [Patescibacteria group bacterium]|nr:hypothetical protein [Patescibacteria group bacterium]